MKFTAIRPILYTQQLRETIDFYTMVFGFGVAAVDLPDEGQGWASLFKDGVEIMLSTPNAHVPFDEPRFTGSFYITTDNLDAVWTRVMHQARICYEPETFPWGMKEFAVYDNNGYVIQFGQPVGN